MAERVEIVTLSGVTVGRFGPDGAKAGRARLDDIKAQLSALILAEPSLRGYRAADLAVRRYDPDLVAVMRDDDPTKVGADGGV